MNFGIAPSNVACVPTGRARTGGAGVDGTDNYAVAAGSNLDLDPVSVRATFLGCDLNLIPTAAFGVDVSVYSFDQHQLVGSELATPVKLASPVFGPGNVRGQGQSQQDK